MLIIDLSSEKVQNFFSRAHMRGVVSPNGAELAIVKPRGQHRAQVEALKKELRAIVKLREKRHDHATRKP